MAPADLRRTVRIYWEFLVYEMLLYVEKLLYVSIRVQASRGNSQSLLLGLRLIQLLILTANRHLETISPDTGADTFFVPRIRVKQLLNKVLKHTQRGASFNLLIRGMREDLRWCCAKMTLMLASTAAIVSKIHCRKFKPDREYVTSVYASISIPDITWYLCSRYKCKCIPSPLKMFLGICWRLEFYLHNCVIIVTRCCI